MLPAVNVCVRSDRYDWNHCAAVASIENPQNCMEAVVVNGVECRAEVYKVWYGIVGFNKTSAMSCPLSMASTMSL